MLQPNELLERFIALIEKDLSALEQKETITQSDALKLVDYAKTIMSIEKKAPPEKEPKTADDMDDAILKEAEQIKAKRKNGRRSK